MTRYWKLTALALLLLGVLTGMVMTTAATINDLPAQDDDTGPTNTPLPTNTPAPTLTPSTTPPPPIPAGALTGTIIRANVLFARQAPYLGAAVVERVRRGETYQVVGRDPDAEWFLLQLYGGRGWVWGYYLFVDGNAFNAPVINPYTNFGDPSDDANLVVQTNAALKLRERPNVASAQIGRVPWGDTLPVIGRARVGSWYQVVYQDTVGWVFSPYTSVVEGNLDNVPFVDANPNPPPAADPDYNINVTVITATPVPPTPTPTPLVIIVTATPSP